MGGGRRYWRNTQKMLRNGCIISFFNMFHPLTNALLSGPAQQHLGWGQGKPLGHTRHCRVLQQWTLLNCCSKGGVSLQVDPLTLTVILQFLLDVVGMVLNLYIKTECNTDEETALDQPSVRSRLLGPLDRSF